MIPKNKKLKIFNLALLSIISLITLFFTKQYFKPIVDYLDSDMLSIMIGDTKISAYKIIMASVSVTLVLSVTRTISTFTTKKIKTLEVRSINKQLLIKIVQVTLYFIAFVVSFEIIGINLTSIKIFSGAIGVGIGFGLQKIIGNFVSGIILLYEESIREGDVINLPSDDIFGFVGQVGARHTVIRKFDGTEALVPNERFITNPVVSSTYSSYKARADISIIVSYESDLEKAKIIIEECAKEHPRCIEEPAPVCFLVKLGKLGAEFTLFFWVHDVTLGLYGPKNDITFSILKRFKENNIRVPHPRDSVYVQSVESSE